jgi:hypothetical protein
LYARSAGWPTTGTASWWLGLRAGRGGNGKSRLWARRPGRDAALLTPPQASEHGSASSELLAAKLSACGGEVTVAELAAGDPTGQSTVVEGVIYAIRPVGIDDAVVVT